MREIKFRAWDADEGRMWYSHENGNAFLDNRNEEHTFYFNFNPKTGNMEAVAESFPYLVASDPFDVYDTDKHYLTIMQYTGFTDKNGKEIYDGDIAKYMQYKTPIVIIWDCKFAAFDFYHVGDEGTRHILSPRIASESIEVIGNTYENPELLEEVMK